MKRLRPLVAQAANWEPRFPANTLRHAIADRHDAVSGSHIASAG